MKQETNRGREMNVERASNNALLLLSKIGEMKKNYRSIMNLFRKYLFYIHKSAYFALCLKEV